VPCAFDVCVCVLHFVSPRVEDAACALAAKGTEKSQVILGT